MTALDHLVVMASAGTGKTYRLSSRYISLLASGVEPETILAATFTRKAAGEIFDRIVERLVEASLDDESLAELNASLLEGVTLTAPDCTRLLGELMKRVDQLQVRTLDATFGRLARSFSLDLGFPAGLEMMGEVEEGALQVDALDQAVSGLGDGKLLHELARQPGSREIQTALMDGLKSLYRAFLESDEAAWLPSLAVSQAPEKGTLERAHKRLEAMDVATTQKNEPNKTWEKAKNRILEALEARKWTAVLGESLLCRSVLGVERYSRAVIEEHHRESLNEVAEVGLAGFLADEARHVGAMRTLLAAFDESWRTLEGERGVFCFDDIPRRLADAALDRPRLAWRMGQQIDHLLLDEFQDTSVLQWRAIEPIAKDLLSHDDGSMSIFCVGDVKQSIYGWRGGEPRLLPELPSRFEHFGDPQTLEENWRSSPVILDTVNRFFGGLSEVVIQEDWFDEDLKEAVEAWSAAFSEHRCSPKTESLPGMAELIEIEENPQRQIESTAAIVAEVHRENPRGTVGVLYRASKPMAALLHCLAQDHGIRASGERGNPLIDSKAVVLALSLLRLADHPGDRSSFLHLATSPFAEDLELQFSRPEEELAQARKLSASIRHRLQDRGYGHLLTQFQEKVDQDESFSSWDRMRFAQLVERGFAHDRRPSSRPVDFVDFIREVPVANPSQAKVRVLTIHGAKGLEFDAVVLPDLGGRLLPGQQRLWTRREDPFGALDGVCRSVKKEILPLLEGPAPDLVALAGDDRRRRFEESLSLLYVAMTRAKRRLVMLATPEAEKSTSPRPSLLIRRLLGAGEQDDRGVIWAHPENSAEWAVGIEEEAPKEEDGTLPPRGAALGLGPTTGPRLLNTRAPSARGDSEKVGVTDLLERDGAEARNRGTLFHRWFEEIEWANGYERDGCRDEMIALGRATAPDLSEEAIAEHLDEFHNLLDGETVRKSLTDPLDGTEREVWRERDFLIRSSGSSGEEPFLMNGSFDRVVLEKGEEGFVKAEIIDYKTGAMDNVEAAVQHYSHQMKSYRWALGQLTGLPEEAISCSLLFVDRGEVKNVPPD